MRARLFALLLALAASIPAPIQANAATLFEQMGGAEGLTRITNDAIDLALVNPIIKDSFSETNIPRFRALLYAQFCELTGGPCKYEGRSMARSHAPLKLTNLHFNALVEDLQTAMDRAKIPFSVQNRFLAILAPMQRDVVTR
ncbi:MAG: group I truncated hemoglobin [Elsteraceae bacterium]